MADPKKPKQLSEADVLVEFTSAGNIYVDPAYTSEETTPATSPITGEALTFGENTLINFTANNNNSPAIQPEDGHAIFISNLNRGTARGNGHDYFFGYNRGKLLYDTYIINSFGGDYSASPRTADKYSADSDGTLNVYIEGSTFGGNLMGFGSQTDTSQTFTGNYEFTFKNSQAQWFCITYGTGYGMGEGGAGNVRFGSLYGNIDLLVDGSTVTNNGVILAGGIHPGDDGAEKAYLRAYIKDSLFQGEFGVIKTGVDGTHFKSEVDVDLTIDGSTFTNVFLMFPNVSTNSQVRDGKNTTTGDVNFKATNTRFAGLNMGAGLGGTGWNRTGWIKGNINFDISGSSNSSRTFIHKGFIGTADEPNTVTGTLTNSVFGDFTGYDTRENNHIYADTTIKMTGSTIGNFTFYNTVGSGGSAAATADLVHGAQKLELTGVVAGNVAGNMPTADGPATQSEAQFNLTIKASEIATQVGTVSHWDSITIDAGATVRATSLSTLDGGKVSIAVGSNVSASSISDLTVLYVTGELTEADTVIISGLGEDGVNEDLILYVGDTEVEYTKGIFPGYYDVQGGNLIIHNATSTVLLVNSNYTDGQATDLGPKGYSTIAKAQAAVSDKDTTTIMVYSDDGSVEPSTFSEAVVTKDFTTSLSGSESNKINLGGQDIVIGDSAADTASANFTASYTNNINKVSFGNVAGTAKVAIDHAASESEEEFGIASLDMTGANVADAQVSISDSTINEVKLADQEGFAGNVTIKNSTITSVYGAASGAVNDLTAGNTIKTVYAENNGASIKLGSSAVGTYVAGLSSDSAARETLEFNDAINAGTLIIGDASVDNSGDEPAINGVANSIGKIEANITAGSAETLIVGAANNQIGEIDLTLAGGKFTDVNIAKDASVTGPIEVTLKGGTILNFDQNGNMTTGSSTDGNAHFYGLIYGASITGPLDGGDQGTSRTLNVEGHAKVASVANFTALNVTGGTLNVAGGDRKSTLSDENSLVIDGDILNKRTINAGLIEAKNINNYGAIGTLRDVTATDKVGITATGNVNNYDVILTSGMIVGGNLVNTGKITAVGDITVGGTFDNSGDIYFYATSSREGVFTQKGGLSLNNVDLVNSGFISAGTLTGVKNLTTSKMYVTGGAEISGNITIDAGAEVCFTNKANQELANGLTLGGSITMGDTSNLVVSGDLSTTGAKTITVNCGDLIGVNEIVRAEGGVNAWTIKLAGVNAGNYEYVQTETSVVIYSTDQLFVNSGFSADADCYVDGNKLAFGKNAFATVADAVAAAKAGTKIVITGDATGMDVNAAAFDVVIDGSVVGDVTAKSVSVTSDSTV
ncbi:MAG: hypothetical protein IKP09_06365, partial [Lentisphaeria bacterium]|nr:hypothetical protein [Lentisphaeria bacterium]